VEIKRNVCSVYGAILFCGLVCPLFAAAQESDSASTKNPAPVIAQDATQIASKTTELPPCSNGPIGEAAKEQRRKAIASIAPNYRTWLTEDVTYLITPGDICVFLRLGSDAEREQFIESFWLRRAPDSESIENTYKQEHYRRIVLANERFAADVPGWKTDRGRVYILYGPPDEVDSHPVNDSSWQALEGEPRGAKYSWEEWHYNYLDFVGENVDCDFVDAGGAGNYHLRAVQQDNVALLFLPVHFLGDVRSAGAGPGAQEQIEIYVSAQPTGKVKYKDLEALVTAHIIRAQVRFDQRIEYAQATHASTVATISVNIPRDQLNTPNKEQESTSGYAIYGRVTNPTGRIAYTFERTVKFAEPEESHHGSPNQEAMLALEPGPYDLAIAVKDISNGKVGVTHTKFEVPRFEELTTGN
jgi:GWxTD domain-containing protein